MPDHEVHEIQLNGKQLVFMFMAATVVSVVIFLCGVMVGRGVREPQAELLAATPDSLVDPTAPLAATSSRVAPPADPAPAPAQENLTYAEHLEAPVAPNEPLKPAAPKPTAPAVTEKAASSKPAPSKPEPSKAEASKPEAPKPEAPKVVEARGTKDAVGQPPAAQKAPAATPVPTIVSASLKEPPGNGHVVQVMAFPAMADAEALARRLTAKGYRTFVTLNEAAPRARYRVRIGKYATRPEAVAAAAKLKQEERFEPWVTR